MTNPSWNYDGDLHRILIACVGLNFGDAPETKLEEIRNDRARTGNVIRHKLALRPSDVVVDIGSGCGFVTRAIVPHVAQMHCVDVSRDFLNYTRSELAEFSNVRYHLIDYASLSSIESGSVDAVYSTAVFIHFNYYDMIFYLKEAHRILNIKGKLLFDFLNSDRLDVNNERTFGEHLFAYRNNRERSIFNVVHPFSLRTLENLLPQIGFRIERVEFLEGKANTTVIVVRI